MQYSSSGVIGNVNRIYDYEIPSQIHRSVRHNRPPNVRQTVIELILMFVIQTLYTKYKILFQHSTFDGIFSVHFRLDFGFFCFYFALD